MKHIAGLLALWLTMGFILSCCHENKIMSRTELASYIASPENGLKKQQEINGITAEMRYQPAELLALQALGTGKQVNKQQFDSALKAYSQNYYFVLKLSKQGSEAIRQLGSFSRYSDMVQVLSFQMHQFVNLTAAPNDTIPLADYMFEQTYGMSDGNTILLCFDKSKLTNKDLLDINIAECGLGTGAMKFSFRREYIEDVPNLNYSKMN